MDTNSVEYQRSLLSRFQGFVVTSGAPIQVLSSNPRRVGVVLSSSRQSALTYLFGAGPTSSMGIYIGAANAPVILYRRDVGSLIEQALFVIGDGASSNGGVIEVFEP